MKQTDFQEDCDMILLLRAAFGGGQNHVADEESIARLWDDRDRQAAAVEMAGAPALRRGVASLANLMPVSAGFLRPPGRHRAPRAVAQGIVALTAAAALVLFFAGPFRDYGPGAHRSGQENPNQLVLVAPVVGSDNMVVFDWRTVLGADRYEFTLMDSQGAELMRTETSDTNLAVGSIIQPGSDYFYRVRARVARDRWLASDFFEFTLDP